MKKILISTERDTAMEMSTLLFLLWISQYSQLAGIFIMNITIEGSKHYFIVVLFKTELHNYEDVRQGYEKRHTNSKHTVTNPYVFYYICMH